MRSTAALTSSSTLRSSASSSSSTVTMPRFSWAVERMRLMPSMEAMASSTRTHTPSSASAGDRAAVGTANGDHVGVELWEDLDHDRRQRQGPPATKMKTIMMLARRGWRRTRPAAPCGCPSRFTPGRSLVRVRSRSVDPTIRARFAVRGRFHVAVFAVGAAQGHDLGDGVERRQNDEVPVFEADADERTVGGLRG